MGGIDWTNLDQDRNSGGPLRERDHLEDPSLEGRIILKWILSK